MKMGTATAFRPSFGIICGSRASTSIARLGISKSNGADFSCFTTKSRSSATAGIMVYVLPSLFATFFSGFSFYLGLKIVLGKLIQHSLKFNKELLVFLCYRPLNWVSDLLCS